MEASEKTGDDSEEENVVERAEDGKSPPKENNQKSEEKTNEKEKNSFFNETSQQVEKLLDVFLNLLKRHFPNHWVFLAIVSFGVALFFAYSAIWVGLEVHDEPIYLEGYYENRSGYHLPAKVSIVCNTSSNVFKENERMGCSITLSPPDQESKYQQNFPRYPRTIVSGWLCDHYPVNNWSGDCTEKPVDISRYKTYTIRWTLKNPGSKYLVFNMYTPSKEYSMSSTYVHNHPDIGDPQETHLVVRSQSEVNQQNITRVSVMITSLFALFGIFPAVYYLRKLWRDENK